MAATTPLIFQHGKQYSPDNVGRGYSIGLRLPEHGLEGVSSGLNEGRVSCFTSNRACGGGGHLRRSHQFFPAHHGFPLIGFAVGTQLGWLEHFYCLGTEQFSAPELCGHGFNPVEERRVIAKAGSGARQLGFLDLR